MLEHRLLILFRGREDVVAMDGSHGHPVPKRLNPGVSFREQWHYWLRRHLDGKTCVGVYPIERDEVHWGCVDFDEGETESWMHSLNLVGVLDSFGITGHIERSRSKGYHVWVFAPRWVSARLMRRALLAACQIAQAPTKEINPKAEGLPEDVLGNFVRLPYYGQRMVSGERQVVVTRDGTPMSFRVWISNVSPDATAEVLAVLADAWEPPHVPPPPKRQFTQAGEWQQQMSTMAREIWLNGPLDGQDRSSYLYALACSCAASGLDEDQIVLAVTDADQLHTHKYEGRKDADRRYQDLAQRALIHVGMVP